MRYYLSLILIGLALSSCRPDLQPVEGITVTTSQEVHPVLIRSEHNGLLRIVVNVQRDDEVKLQSMHFTLDGTDNVGDVESLELFTTSEKEEFSTASGFGKPLAAARTLAFRGDQVLRPGKNVFWLSCRLKPTANLLHRVGASCTVVETSVGKIRQKDPSPGIGHRIGIALRKHNDDKVHTYRIPVLATTPKGTLSFNHTSCFPRQLHQPRRPRASGPSYWLSKECFSHSKREISSTAVSTRSPCDLATFCAGVGKISRNRSIS